MFSTVTMCVPDELEATVEIRYTPGHIPVATIEPSASKAEKTLLDCASKMSISMDSAGSEEKLIVPSHPQGVVEGVVEICPNAENEKDMHPSIVK
jgi:hypothetical protein